MAEDEYRGMRSEVEADLGLRPSARRIRQLDMRRGGVDCVTAVGSPDPVRGGVVMAIFDLGPRRPFVVWRQVDVDPQDQAYEELGCTAYSVLEFDA
ncbi:MAG TPA: hypothetical protein VHX88_11155 [Solirubrobacteraceae bacterium]|nr:hypothetical protein [Solirubrobacteraceae bacterium]